MFNQNCANFILVFLIIKTTHDVVGKDMKDMDVNELIALAEDISQVRPNDVTKSDVNFYLFTRNQSEIHLTSPDPNIFESKLTKFLIHGWLESHQNSWDSEITHEFLNKDDFAVIQVDWQRVARSSYVSSSRNVKLVGEFLGEFIIDSKIDLEKVHLIGHSLGAHVAGFAGKFIKKATGKQIYRITALDAAGPNFQEFFVTPNERLNKNDAKIVDAIHTDGGFYGYDKPIGTLDIYVNGGVRVQPGCLENFKISSPGQFISNTFCSHASSHKYFSEAINSKKFSCQKCDNFDFFQDDKCKSNEKYSYGVEEITESMTGPCFVTTRTSLINPNTYNDLGRLFTSVLPQIAKNPLFQPPVQLQNLTNLLKSPLLAAI